MTEPTPEQMARWPKLMPHGAIRTDYTAVSAARIVAPQPDPRHPGQPGYVTFEYTLRPDGDPVTQRVAQALRQIYRLPDWQHHDPVGHLLSQYATLRAQLNALDCRAPHQPRLEY